MSSTTVGGRSVSNEQVIACRMQRWHGACGRAFAAGGIQRCLRARHVMQALLALAIRRSATLASVPDLQARSAYGARGPPFPSDTVYALSASAPMDRWRYIFHSRRGRSIHFARSTCVRSNTWDTVKLKAVEGRADGSDKQGRVGPERGFRFTGSPIPTGPQLGWGRYGPAAIGFQRWGD
jgi:hypothetical protein